jgi:Multiubiquitin
MPDEKTFSVTVDGDPVEVPRKDVTANQILTLAHLDPTQRYLIQKHGNETISYIDNPDALVKVHEHEAFLTGRRGPVTVS